MSIWIIIILIWAFCLVFLRLLPKKNMTPREEGVTYLIAPVIIGILLVKTIIYVAILLFANTRIEI